MAYNPAYNNAVGSTVGTVLLVGAAMRHARERKNLESSLQLEKPKQRVEEKMQLHGYTMGLFLESIANIKDVGKKRCHGGTFKLSENSTGTPELSSLTEEFRQALSLTFKGGPLGRSKRANRVIEEAKKKCDAIAEKHGIRVQVIPCDQTYKSIRLISGVVWGDKVSAMIKFNAPSPVAPVIGAPPAPAPVASAPVKPQANPVTEGETETF